MSNKGLIVATPHGAGRLLAVGNTVACVLIGRSRQYFLNAEIVVMPTTPTCWTMNDVNQAIDYNDADQRDQT